MLWIHNVDIANSELEIIVLVVYDIQGKENLPENDIRKS